jgi:hypothetical protein
MLKGPVVYNCWTGMVDWSGLEWWTDWNDGLEWWTDWNDGLEWWTGIVE